MDVALPFIRKTVLTLAHPFLQYLGRIELPVNRLMGETQFFDLMNNPEFTPGCVLLSRKRLAASNLFIPGEWKHATMYVGKRGGGLQANTAAIVQSTWPRVEDKTLLEWMKTEDYLLVLKPTFCGPTIMQAACDFAWSIRGDGYDLMFDYTDTKAANKAFYCSEVIWWSYDQAMAAVGLKSPFTPQLSMGVPTIAPSDFSFANTKFKIIAEWARNKGC